MRNTVLEFKGVSGFSKRQVAKWPLKLAIIFHISSKQTLGGDIQFGRVPLFQGCNDSTCRESPASYNLTGSETQEQFNH